MTDWKQKLKSLEGWHFGGKGSGLEDSLLNLVLKGVKTATSSWYETYEVDNEPLPKEGEQSYIMNSKDDPICIIELVKIEIKPFLEVQESFAFLEGEGDRSLRHWREAHTEFFTKSAKQIGLNWDPKPQHVVRETFKVLHIFEST